MTPITLILPAPRVLGALSGRRAPSGRGGRTWAARRRRCAAARPPRSTRSGDCSDARAAALARDAVALEHLPARRAVPAGQPRQPHRPPVGLLARARGSPALARRVSAHGHDRGTGRRGAHHAPLCARPRWPPASDHAPWSPSSASTPSPARPPRLLAGEHARHHLTLRARSEPASTVCHVRPSLGALVVATTSLRRGPDVPSAVH